MTTTWIRSSLANKQPHDCARCGKHFAAGTARLWRPKDGAMAERGKRVCNECMKKEKRNVQS